MSEALVLIDFVNDLVSEGGKLEKLGAPKHVAEQHAIEHAKHALDAARRRGAKVIFVRVCFEEGHPELAGLNAPFYVAHRQNNWLVKGTWGAQFHDELQPQEGEVVLEKQRVNPFTNPQFEAELAGIDTVVVAGVSTNLAVEETVRNGAAKGINLVVLEDSCASNNQAMHEFSVNNTLSRFAKLSTSDEYVAS